jgi:hypothetical protein
MSAYWVSLHACRYGQLWLLINQTSTELERRDFLRAAIKTAREGATYRELRANYYAEAARRGNRDVFMVINGISAEGVDAGFRDGASQD